MFISLLTPPPLVIALTLSVSSPGFGPHWSSPSPCRVTIYKRTTLGTLIFEYSSSSWSGNLFVRQKRREEKRWREKTTVLPLGTDSFPFLWIIIISITIYVVVVISYIRAVTTIVDLWLTEWKRRWLRLNGWRYVAKKKKKLKVS